MVRTKFYLDERRTASGRASILKLSVSHKRKVSYLSLDIRLKHTQWNPIKQQVVNHPDSFRLNNYLREVQRKADEEIFELLYAGKLNNMTATYIRDLVAAGLQPTAPSPD